MTKHKAKKPSAKELQKHVAKLEREVDQLQHAKTSVNTAHRLRNVGAGLAAGLTSLLLVFSIAAVWLQQTLLDNETWVKNANQVIQNESVRNDIADSLTNAIFTSVDVQKYVAEVLPPRAEPLAQPISNSIEGFTTKQINNGLASQAFLDFWSKANQSAHQGIVNSLEAANKASTPEAQGNVIFINNDQLVLNLQPVLDNLKTNLESKGLGFVSKINLSGVNKEFTLAQIQNLPTVLAVFNTINNAGNWLPLLTVVFGAGAILLATSRRRALMGIAATSIVFLIIGIQLVFFAQYPFISSLQDTLANSSSNSMQAIYQIYTANLVLYNRVAAALMAIVLVFAYLGGPGRGAVWLRRQISKLFSGHANSPAAKWLGQNAYMVIGSLVALSAVLIIIPIVHGPSFPIWLAVIVGLLSVFLLGLRNSLDLKK